MKMIKGRFFYQCQNCGEKFYNDNDVPKIRGIVDSLILAKTGFEDKLPPDLYSRYEPPPPRFSTHNCSAEGIVGVGEIISGYEIKVKE